MSISKEQWYISAECKRTRDVQRRGHYMMPPAQPICWHKGGAYKVHTPSSFIRAFDLSAFKLSTRTDLTVHKREFAGADTPVARPTIAEGVVSGAALPTNSSSTTPVSMLDDEDARVIDGIRAVSNYKLSILEKKKQGCIEVKRRKKYTKNG